MNSIYKDAERDGGAGYGMALEEKALCVMRKPFGDEAITYICKMGYYSGLAISWNDAVAFCIETRETGDSISSRLNLNGGVCQPDGRSKHYWP